MSFFDKVCDWAYEFRIPIITVILLAMLIGFHNCEFRVSIDSRPSTPADAKK
jgi:hypothetical protein